MYVLLIIKISYYCYYFNFIKKLMKRILVFVIFLLKEQHVFESFCKHIVLILIDVCAQKKKKKSKRAFLSRLDCIPKKIII